MSDNFGDRMKTFEVASDTRLPIRMPVILRLDGNSFSLFTKQRKFEKPFDNRFSAAMTLSTQAVLKYCSGSQVAYTQSDEITVLLRNDQTFETSPFLANRIQKICSLVASTASVAFCNALNSSYKADDEDYISAVFDCRAFVVPSNEVNNVFLWRQQDAFKNCVSAVAWYGLKQKYGNKSAQKILDGLSTNQRQETIFKELNININDYPTKYKRGVCIYKENYNIPLSETMSAELITKLNKNPNDLATRSRFKVDEDIPLFNQDTNFINKYLQD